MRVRRSTEFVILLEQNEQFRMSVGSGRVRVHTISLANFIPGKSFRVRGVAIKNDGDEADAEREGYCSFDDFMIDTQRLVVKALVDGIQR